MATSITYGFKDFAGDIGYTGFTLDGTVSLAQVQAFAGNIESLSDGAWLS